MGSINLYVDEETEKLLKNKLNITPSKLFKAALKKYLWERERTGKAVNELLNTNELEEQFKFFPTAEDIRELSEEISKLVNEDHFKELYRSL